MKTIVDKYTGKVLYCRDDEPTLENEIAIDKILTVFYIKPFFNFETKEFYEGASEQEMLDYNNNL
jgi:hypothetical protein